MNSPSILVVDDSLVDLEIVSMACASMGFSVDTSKDGAEALELFKQKRHSLVLADYKMEPLDGIDVISKIHEIDPTTTCMVMTGFPDTKVNQLAITGDIFRIFTKPIRTQDLVEALKIIINQHRGATDDLEGIALANRMDECLSLIGTSSEIRSVRDSLRNLIRSRKALCVEAPEGSRKSEIARFIHVNGSFGKSHYVVCDCRTLVDGGDFERLINTDGSWGALLSEAKYGTLVLAHLEALPAQYQEALASVFNSLSSAMHVILLTEAPYEEMLEHGHLCDLLYFELATEYLRIPALVERPQDISEMLDYIAENYERFGLPRAPSSMEISMLEQQVAAQPLERNVDELIERVSNCLACVS